MSSGYSVVEKLIPVVNRGRMCKSITKQDQESRQFLCVPKTLQNPSRETLQKQAYCTSK